MLKIVDYLDLVIPHLSLRLVSPESPVKMRSVASQFPAALTRCFGFECHLNSQAAETDFLFSITRPERDVFFKGGQQRAFDSSLLIHPLWKRISDFYQVWADPNSVLHSNVLQTSLEFDLERSGDALSRPGFFFGSKKIPPARPNLFHNFDWLYKTALPLLAGARLPRAVEDTLRRCIARLPAGSYMYAIGAFYAREIPHLRVCIGGLDPARITLYLEEIGCPADLTELRHAIAELAPLAQIHLTMDIGEGVGPKIGFECRQDGSTYIGLQARESAFLEYLQRIGCCSAEEKYALLRFPGFMDSRAAGQDWYDRSQGDGGEPHPGLVSTVRRDLSHIKVVIQPGKPVSAKAYLQVVHDWFPPSAVLRYALIYQAREKETAHYLKNQPSGEAAATDGERIA